MVVGSSVTGKIMVKNSLIEYVDLRDQEILERIKNNVTFVLEEKFEDDLSLIDEITWKKIVDISSRVDFTETFVPVDMFLDYPYSDFRQRHPDFVEKRVSLHDAAEYCLIGFNADDKTSLIPIRVDGSLVGYIGYRPRSVLTETLDIELADRQNILITFGTLFVVLVAGVLFYPAVRYFLAPIQAVARGMRKLSGGDYSTRLSINRADEMGQLQQDFNQLASALEKSQQSRNQWIADISHELRTPLTILRGDIEALSDGVRQPTQENLENTLNEILHLNRLVEDLYQIALSDAGGLQYQMLPNKFTDLVRSQLETFRPTYEQKGLKLVSKLPRNPIKIVGDYDRLQQLLTNLLHNSFKYTDAPGEVRVSLCADATHLCLVIEDSSPGVAENEINQLFDRFYRIEASRNRRLGGAGIGLALVAQIVQAHQGTISAEASKLGGIKISINLPLEAYAS